MDNNDIYTGIIFENNMKVNEIKYITMIIKNVLDGKKYSKSDKLYQVVYKNIKEKK
jgi:hypothetical protein